MCEHFSSALLFIMDYAVGASAHTHYIQGCQRLKLLIIYMRATCQASGEEQQSALKKGVSNHFFDATVVPTITKEFSRTKTKE